MKLCIVSHSLIHPRQYFFVEELRRQGVTVLEIYPKKWGNLRREGGFEVHSEGKIYEYVFGYKAIEEIRVFKPDWLYVQMEPNSLVAYQMSSLAKRLCRFACFTWENIEKIYPFPFQQETLNYCNLIICGNSAARQIMLNKSIDPNKLATIPQVGIQTDLFKQMNCPKEISVLFVGRFSAEKGVKLIKEAYPDTTFVTNIAYMELPSVYSRVKISVQFSYSTPMWKEQSGNYVNLEAMSCGLPIISSRCGSIPEYLKGSEAYLVAEKDVKGLTEGIEYLLSMDDDEREEIGQRNREFVLGKYSNRVVAEKLVAELEKR